MENDKLQFTHCLKCDSSYLIGIGNKDIRKKGSSEGTDNLFAIGNDEIEAAKELDRNSKIPCAKCGELCEIKDSTESKEDSEEEK
jgi:hypothetical protein